MNSIGSSTVMMCPFSSLLILSIIAASVVLLPDPVGPVTSTRPRGFSDSFATTPGNPSSSKVRTLNGICRITSDTQPRCLKQLPRNRARFWMPNERSEEHTSELQSQSNLVCRLLLEKKKNKVATATSGESADRTCTAAECML